MGKDTSKDNLAVYSDGSAFCFSCRYLVKGNKPVLLTVEKEENPPKTYKSKPRVQGPNFFWLSQYLTADEIDEYFFMDPLWNRHIFIHNEGEPDWFLEARSVVPGGAPKSIQQGTKPSFIIGRWKETRIIVIVEDVVSAITVGRHYGAMPLFGADMAARTMMNLKEKNCADFVLFWLDKDKFIDAQKLSRRMGMLIPSACVWTDEDPKATDDSTIQELVKEAFNERNKDSSFGSAYNRA
jgi:hypothetical protein